MDIGYRRTKTEDMPSILDILNNVSGNVKDISFEQFLVVEDKNKIVGCIRIKKIIDCFELASLAVLPEYRDRGIGSNLVRKILEEFDNRPVYLFCNVKNQGFYKKFGFELVKTENIPEALKEDYYDLLNLKFASNTKLLTCMVLAQ